jgi:hypothetical protein
MHPTELVHKRLMRALWMTEVSVIAITAGSGLNLSLGHGGSVAMAAPLFLISAVELVRIPLAGWSTRLGIAGKASAAVALAAIAVMSFEGLSMAFEQFVNNRVVTVMHAQHDVEKAQRAVDHVNEARGLADADLAKLTSEANQLDKQITELSRTMPSQAKPSNRVCTQSTKKGVMKVACGVDVTNANTYQVAMIEYNSRLGRLEADRHTKQAQIDTAHGKETAIDDNVAADNLSTAKQALIEELQTSPMHRVAASVYGVPVAQVTEAQFNVVKNFAMFGLAGAISVMTMLVSLIAHMMPKSDRPGKVGNAIRALVARWRRPLKVNVVKEVPGPETIRTVEIPVPVPGPETVKIKWLAYDHATGRRIKPDGELGDTIPFTVVKGNKS